MILLTGYVLAAHMAWMRTSADLNDVTNRIEAVARASGASGSSGGASAP